MGPRTQRKDSWPCTAHPETSRRPSALSCVPWARRNGSSVSSSRSASMGATNEARSNQSRGFARSRRRTRPGWLFGWVQLAPGTRLSSSVQGLSVNAGSPDFEEVERRVVERDRHAFATLEHAYEDVIYRFFLFKTNDRNRSSKLT